MSKNQPNPVKRPSLADYLVRYDLGRMIEEAKHDYSEASPGPRLLNQRDISARFRRTGSRRGSGQTRSTGQTRSPSNG